MSRELELKFIKIHWYKKDNSRNQKTITVGRDMELQVDANQNQMETETLIQAATWLLPDSPAATPTEPPILSLLKALLRRYLN